MLGFLARIGLCAAIENRMTLQRSGGRNRGRLAEVVWPMSLRAADDNTVGSWTWQSWALSSQLAVGVEERGMLVDSVRWEHFEAAAAWRQMR